MCGAQNRVAAALDPARRNPKLQIGLQSSSNLERRTGCAHEILERARSSEGPDAQRSAVVNRPGRDAGVFEIIHVREISARRSVRASNPLAEPAAVSREVEIKGAGLQLHSFTNQLHTVCIRL